MSTRTYTACRAAVSSEHGNPPDSFLDELIDAIEPLPDAVFAVGPRDDIYSVMEGALGPWTGLLQRKAAMCEVLRVLAAFESDWNWNEGVDVDNERSETHLQSRETGIFQVSADSMAFDPSLPECVDRLAGGHDDEIFIHAMKSNHALAVEYCARLLRFDTGWSGTIDDRSDVIDHVSRASMAEFATSLTVGGAPSATATGA
ncbi:MAG TPA: hypothetical protein VGO11_08890 [Chthoniobacteraceae bacterium]|jgi:hypothetical protein|nr:hypothetical protein [Chthoniobacteraceae bacterium]